MSVIAQMKRLSIVCMKEDRERLLESLQNAVKSCSVTGRKGVLTSPRLKGAGNGAAYQGAQALSSSQEPF